MPQLLCCDPLTRTPSPSRGHAVISREEVLTPIFEECQKGILPTPDSTPPRPPTTRRKTIASVKISNKGGILSLHKTKRAGPRTTIPVAKAVEKLLCYSLGIVRDGEDVTQAMLADFTAKFKD
ncbi:hypothetical protein D1007_41053 [Hordeum vulgare]|nr:hypothetical protein D1007_41053 [Hordeum vulgare]